MTSPRFLRSVFCASVGVGFATFFLHASANPLSGISETFSDWKARLFGGSDRLAAVGDAPAKGTIFLHPDSPVRVRIGAQAPEREFSKGKSRYRVIELPQELEHASVRIQVVAQDNPKERGNVVFRPFLYVLDGQGEARDPVEVKPLHIDIRPFRRTRLLGCVTLDKVQRFAVATAPEYVGKSYESEVRKAVKAPTQGGFYYATDALKIKLPYAETGTVVLQVSSEKTRGEGC